MAQQNSQIPEVSLNTFSAWMAHLTGTSDMHSFSQYKGLHQQNALEGIQEIWNTPSLKELGSGDIFKPLSDEKQFMVIINGVNSPSAFLPFQEPSLYVQDNDGNDFTDVALDTMSQYADKMKADTQKIENVLNNLDINDLPQVMESFKTHYKSYMDIYQLDYESKAVQTFMVEVEQVRNIQPKEFNVIEMNGLQMIGQEYGTDSRVYQEAQQIISQLISNKFNQHQKGTTLILTPMTTNVEQHQLRRRQQQQQPDQRIDLTSDFQLLFWTGVFLILLTSGIVTFAFSLGNNDTGGVVLTTSTLPKQD
ncbi:hypothetical protein BJ944DRAFT_234152 [Cunninghamella echinulata]|nr:hypothetical protein BJ944DRAFT_234152 [Cunninghamella echinulata]